MIIIITVQYCVSLTETNCVREVVYFTYMCAICIGPRVFISAVKTLNMLNSVSSLLCVLSDSAGDVLCTVRLRAH